MRTGSIGNRTADELVKTLVEHKKTTISSIRSKLLSLGLQEEVEYDSINIEPVLIYSLSNERRVFLKSKWKTSALVRLISREKAENILKRLGNKDEPFSIEENRDDGTLWMEFDIPRYEETALKTLSESMNSLR